MTLELRQRRKIVNHIACGLLALDPQALLVLVPVMVLVASQHQIHRL